MVDVIWEVWVSTLSPTTCQVCRSLHGKLFRRGEGPMPQLHNFCQCQRRYHHTEVAPTEGPSGQPPLEVGPSPAPAPALPPAPVTPPRPPSDPILPFIPLWPGDDDDDDDEDEE